MTIQKYIEVASLFKQYENHPEKETKVMDVMLSMMPNMKLKDAQKQVLSYMETLSFKSDDVTLRFKLNDLEYGLIPDLDNITTEEFLFLQKYNGDINQIHKLMAVLYRPISSSYGQRYDVEKFNPKEMDYKSMLGVDVKVWLSVQSFFLTLYQRLLIHTAKSLEEKVNH